MTKEKKTGMTFELNDKVYDARYGWGVVNYVGRHRILVGVLFYKVSVVYNHSNINNLKKEEL
jgi:hypothetical protein